MNTLRVYRCWICKKITLPNLLNEKMHQCRCFNVYITEPSTVDSWPYEGVYESLGVYIIPKYFAQPIVKHD